MKLSHKSSTSGSSNQVASCKFWSSIGVLTDCGLPLPDLRPGQELRAFTLFRVGSLGKDAYPWTSPLRLRSDRGTWICLCPYLLWYLAVSSSELPISTQPFFKLSLSKS